MMKGQDQLAQGTGLKAELEISVNSDLISLVIKVAETLTPIVDEAPMELARAVILPVPPGLGIAPLSDGALIFDCE